MRKKDFVQEVIKKCEEIHPNLYHSVEKENVEKFINGVDWNGLNDVEFDYNMLKLFAMFKDAHTSYNINIPYHGFDVRLWYVCGDAFLLQESDMLKVKSINGYPAEQVVEMMAGLMNYETEARKNHMIDSKLGNGYYYKMLGIATDKLSIEVQDKNGTTIVVESKIKIPENKPVQKQDKKNNAPKFSIYNYRIENENILRFNYRSCDNIEGYPFVQFLEDMKRDLQDKNIEGVVVDLRGNGGGRSSIILPFVEYVKENNWPCVVLMDNGTFSSGVIAVRDLKKHCDAVLIGEYAGQGTENYGECPPFELDGKKISCCTKHFDFSDVFGYKGPIKPDIYVQRTVEEFRTGQQTQQVRTAYEVINKMIEEKRNEQTKIID